LAFRPVSGSPFVARRSEWLDDELVEVLVDDGGSRRRPRSLGEPVDHRRRARRYRGPYVEEDYVSVRDPGRSRILFGTR
jgi:hypothetical protein